jgi:opacity protein-like surface antigen
VNGYYDFTNSSQLTPYISAGIGVAQVEVNDLAVLGIPVGSEDDTVFAYQLGVGVGYSVTDAITLDMKYRYFATADPDFDGIDGECASHNVYLGLRYNF